MNADIPTLPRPAVADPTPWRFPAASTATLSNGVNVIVCRLPGQHLAGITAVLDVPVSAEPEGQDGVLTLTARTMDEGTQDHSAEEFARAVQVLGAAYHADVSRAGAWLDIDVPAARLDAAAALLAEALIRPAFDEADVARHRALRLGEIAHEEADPNERARQEFMARIFAPADRYSRPLGGTRETVAGLSAETVAAFHTANVVPERTTLVVAGDLSGLEPEAILERHFGSWRPVASGGPGPVAREWAHHQAGRPHIVIVDRPESVQTNLLIGCPGPDRQAVDWPAHQVAGHVLGGTISSRLNLLLREEKGYTYSVHAGFRTFRQGGYFNIVGSVRGEVTGAAIADTLDLLTRSAKDGFGSAECGLAVGQLTRIAPLRNETAQSVRTQLADLVTAGLPLDFLTHNIAAMSALAPPAVSAAFRDTVAVNDLVVIAVGKAAEISAQLAEAGLPVAAVVPA